MKHTHDKIIHTTLQFFLAASIVWCILFHLVDSSGAEMVHLLDVIIPAWDTLYEMYWSFIPSLISVLIALANVIYAGSKVLHLYKSGQLSTKQGKVYLIYMVISIAALVMHHLTLRYLVLSVIASV